MNSQTNDFGHTEEMIHWITRLVKRGLTRAYKAVILPQPNPTSLSCSSRHVQSATHNCPQSAPDFRVQSIDQQLHDELKYPLHQLLSPNASEAIDAIIEQALPLGREGGEIHFICARFGNEVIALRDPDPRFDWLLRAFQRRISDALAKIGHEVDPATSQIVDLKCGETLSFFDFDLVGTEEQGQLRLSFKQRKPALKVGPVAAPLTPPKRTRTPLRKNPTHPTVSTPNTFGSWTSGTSWRPWLWLFAMTTVIGGAVVTWLKQETNGEAITFGRRETPRHATSEQDSRHGFLRRAIQSTPSEQPVKFVVFIPHNYDYTGTTKYPLILFLHDLGSKGTDGFHHVQSTLGPAVTARQKHFPFITVFPQAGTGTWQPHSNDIKHALSALSDVEKTFRVDVNRECLVGQGWGASAAWDLAEEFPERWAAIAPIFSYKLPTELSKLERIPCWCFHATNDQNVERRNAMRKTMDRLKATSNRARFNEFTGTGEFHSIQDQVFAKDEFFNWLEQQRK